MNNQTQLAQKYPGARWWRFDFHTHTPASTDYGKGTNQEELRKITPEEWLLNFMRAEIDCVAVTDHNSGEWVDRLKAALKQLRDQDHPEYRPLTLFPGVEITANGGIHILAIFEPERYCSDIAALLGAVGYHGTYGESNQSANVSPLQVVQKISNANAIPILAHVDQDCGSWKLNGNTLGPLLDCGDVSAIEVRDPSFEKPELYRQRNLQWAEVLGSDAHHPPGGNGPQYPGSHWTWVKMAKPSLEGLRLALMDGAGFSIRRSDDPDPFDPNALPEYRIESIEIKEAQYMGRGGPETFAFSPWFNALVGGRGTGKSTMVHALRLALRREEELKALENDNEARRTFERFSKPARNRRSEGALTQDTHITLVFLRDGTRYRIHWRQNGSDVVVEEGEDEEWRESSSQSVIPERFPARIFSQGQIAGLTGGSQQALLDLIDEAAGVETQKAELAEAKQTYLSLRAKARELEGRLQGRDKLKVRLEDTQRKLKQFEATHHADVLKTYQRSSRQEREISRQFDAADEIVQKLRAMAEDIVAEDVPDNLFAEDNDCDKEAVSTIERLHKAIDATAKAVEDAANRLEKASGEQRKHLGSTAWKTNLDKLREDYEALKAKLQEQGVDDPSKYGELVQERQKLEKQWKELQAVEKQREKTLQEAEAQLNTVREARKALSRRRASFLKETLQENEYVRIALRPFAQDARSMEQSLRELLGAEHPKFENDILAEQDGELANGLIADLTKSLPQSPTDAEKILEERIDGIKQRIVNTGRGQGDFGGHFNNFLSRETEKRPEFLDHIMLWYPEDGLEVQYSQRGDGNEFKSIEQASAGQRAAAMLAFLLAHGTEPIILDQPEDDLDNHLVYELVVRQLRENKTRRQIIVVTHNPNIVVNGDAEMLHALDFKSGQCRVTQRGSLQDEDMRKEVCDVMEGGHDAFERRYKRLGKTI